MEEQHLALIRAQERKQAVEIAFYPRLFRLARWQFRRFRLIQRFEMHHLPPPGLIDEEISNGREKDCPRFQTPVVAAQIQPRLLRQILRVFRMMRQRDGISIARLEQFVIGRRSAIAIRHNLPNRIEAPTSEAVGCSLPKYLHLHGSD